MDQSLHFLIRYGIPSIFAVVFLSQMGLPLPALPWLLGAGALAAVGQLNFPLGLVTIVLACVLADTIWFYLGRYRGHQILGLLCRVSLEPDSCVRRTRNVFTKYGLPSLLFAKFVPGMNTVAPPLAGLTSTKLKGFLLFDAAGALLYGGCWLGAGYLFHQQISQIAAAIGRIGSDALVVLLGLIALYAGIKYWHRRRLLKELHVARITVAELWNMLNDGTAPLIIDLRAPAELARDSLVIQGAIHLNSGQLPTFLADLAREHEIIVYCSCPNEASSARMALRLRRRGFRQVRPLLGGIDAWRKQNYPLATCKNQP